jgi:hypothetical protein
VTSDQQVSLRCPHCQAELEIRVEVKAAVIPTLRLHFDSRTEFEQWLRASMLTLDEFEALPVYEWHREELEPLVRATREARVGATPPAA